MEIPASVNGVVKAIKVSVGDMAKTGMPFVDIETIKQINPKEAVQSKSNNSDHIIKATENKKDTTDIKPVKHIEPNS